MSSSANSLSVLQSIANPGQTQAPAQTGTSMDVLKSLAQGGSGESNPPAPTPEQQRAKQENDASRNRMNMLSGMTGMPNYSMSAEEKQQFEAGKKAGTIAGATDAAVMGVGGPIIGKVADIAKASMAPKIVHSVVGTGIVDSAGKEIMKDVVKYGPSAARVLGNQITEAALSEAGKKAIGAGSLIGLGWLARVLVGR